MLTRVQKIKFDGSLNQPHPSMNKAEKFDPFSGKESRSCHIETGYRSWENRGHTIVERRTALQTRTHHHHGQPNATSV